MVADLFAKAVEAAQAARNCLDESENNSAVNRAYYAMFNAARAWLASAGMDSGGSHGSVLQSFSLHAIRTGKIDAKFGRMFNRTQEARSVADYDERSVPASDARDFVDGAEAFVDLIGAMIPNLPENLKRGPSAREAFKLEFRRGLARTFCEVVRARGVDVPAGLEERLALEGARETLTEMIAKAGEIKDLADFVALYLKS